jgi:hypothetical protein
LKVQAPDTHVNNCKIKRIYQLQVYTDMDS